MDKIVREDSKNNRKEGKRRGENEAEVKTQGAAIDLVFCIFFVFLTSPISWQATTRSYAISSVTTESFLYPACVVTNCRSHAAVVMISPAARFLKCSRYLLSRRTFRFVGGFVVGLSGGSQMPSGIRDFLFNGSIFVRDFKSISDDNKRGQNDH